MQVADDTVTVGQCPYNPFLPPDRDDPYPAWARIRREQPVFYSEVLDAWVVTRYQDICEIVRDTARFSNSASTTPVTPPPPEVQAVFDEGFRLAELVPLLSADPPTHTRLRRHMNQAFTPQRVAAQEPRIRIVASELIDQFAAEGRVDLVERFAYPLPLTVVMELQGVPSEDRANIHRWSDDKTAIQWGKLGLDEYLAAARGFVEFQRYFAELIEQRRAEPRDDVISTMVRVRVEDERPLSTAELVAQMMGLVSAGHETTMNLIAHAVLHLLRNREQWELLVRDPVGLAPRAVEETLRFDSSVSGLWRLTTEAVEVAGVRIPKGARVHVVFGSANRDETIWDEPDRFDIQRETTTQHLAFGRGTHFCLGAALARLEGSVALELLATRLPSLRLDPDAPPVTWRPNSSFRGPSSLPLVWDLDR
jgi:cytochrome P450